MRISRFLKLNLKGTFSPLKFAMIVLFVLYGLSFIVGDLNKEIQGEIVKVYDGDTITLVENQEKVKIRLYGLDAPELNQSFGKEAREYLLNLCPLHSQAKVKIINKDKYKRVVGIVYCNAINVNEKLVENGFAWAYREYSKDYVALENKARKNTMGLWGEANPLKPSEFRRNQ